MKVWKSVLVVLVCLIAIVAITLKLIPGMTVGRCVIADNGSVLLIDGNTPIVLSGRTGDRYTTGDKLLVLHNGINETYPAQTGALLVLKLGSGTEAVIPTETMMQLAELGWIEQMICTGEPAEPFERVKAQWQYVDMSLPKLENWEYEVLDYTQETDGFNGIGIRFYPAGCPEGNITLDYYDQWGVCGTGLQEETILLGHSYEAWQGTYDDHTLWDFISVKELPGHYVFQNYGAEKWWDEYGKEAMFIIENASLAQGAIGRYAAIAKATDVVQALGVNDVLRPGPCGFAGENGVWTVSLSTDGPNSKEYTVLVYPDGSSELVEATIYD